MSMSFMTGFFLFGVMAFFFMFFSMRTMTWEKILRSLFTFPIMTLARTTKKQSRH